MKVRVGVSASIPSGSRDAYATLSCGEEFGRTEMIHGYSANLIWKKMFVLDWEGDEDATLAVTVWSEGGDSEIGQVQFNIAAMFKGRSNVLYEDIDGGGTIFVHGTENVIDESTLKFQVHGKALENTSVTGFLGKKSDPFYEVQNASGELVYESEVIDNNLEPEWSMAEIGLRSLCGGDFNAPIAFSIFDKDRGDTNKLMGAFTATANDLVIAASRGESMSVSKDGKETGQILVLQAEYVGVALASEVLAAAAEAKELSASKAMVATSKTRAADLAREEFERAQQDAVARRNSELMAKAKLTEAQKAAESAKTESLNAAEEAERIRKAGLMGTLNFQFVGEHLKNVEKLKFMGDKSDPFFVLQKVESERDGKTQWAHVFISNVVKNKLNPIWKESKVEIGDLCRGDLDERIRVVVFDWSRTKKHKLIGSFETSVNGILSAQKSAVRYTLIKGQKKETGRVFVSFAEMSGFADSKAAEEKAKELAEKADNARFYAYGAERKAKLAGKAAEEAQNVALQSEQTAEDAAQEADAAWRLTLERTVSQTLHSLGLGM